MGKAAYIFLDRPSLRPEQAQLLSDLLIHSAGNERLEKDSTSARFPLLRQYAELAVHQTQNISTV